MMMARAKSVSAGPRLIKKKGKATNTHKETTIADGISRKLEDVANDWYCINDNMINATTTRL